MSGDVSTGPGLPTPGHADFEELAAGFALDALEPEEEERFLAHLPGCGRCGVALTQHLEVAAQLAWGVDPVSAPDLPPALAAIIASAPRGLPVDPFPASTAPEDPAADAAEPSPVPEQVSWLRPFAAAGRRGRVLVAAGALGLAALLTAVTVDVAVRGTGTRTEADASRDALLAVNDPGAAVARLAGGAGQSAHGTAVVSQNHAWLVIDGLALSAPGERYVAWEITGFDEMHAAAQFTVTRAGVTSVDLGPVPSAASGSPRYAVTLEGGGQELPSSPNGAKVLNPASPSQGLQ